MARRSSWLLALFMVCALSQAQAQPSDSAPALPTLRYQHGTITLPGDFAQLEVPPSFGYVTPEQASQVLEAWGNPPGQETLGMLFPSNQDPFSEAGWGVVITYDEDGYVSDEDAGEINYDELLVDMQDDTQEANKARAEAGYEKVELVGWAEPPHYEAQDHKMFWAKALKFGDNPDETLNYNIRVLGRRGVLVLNAVAAMNQFAPVKAGMNEVLTFASFTEGNRYEDYKPGVDKAAQYGLAALVAGGVATKTGLFKGLLAALLAGKKFVVLGLVALAAGLKRLFGGKQQPT
jgi:uncharacterized membrane-anchored protein